MTVKWNPHLARAAAFVVVVLLCSGALHAYCVLTHEEIVDLAWKSEPDFGTRVLSVLFRYIPKVGPFKGMGFDNPTPQTEDLYKHQYYGRSLSRDARRGTGTLILPNRDLDDGNQTSGSEYSLADEAYASLLAKLTARRFDGTSPELRANILAFYADLSLPVETRKDPARWQSVLIELTELKVALGYVCSSAGSLHVLLAPLLLAFAARCRMSILLSDPMHTSNGLLQGLVAKHSSAVLNYWIVAQSTSSSNSWALNCS
jgi:hypothetical protein